MELARRITQVNPSPTLQITARAKELKAQGVDVVGFGAGEPDFDTPGDVKEAAIKAINDGFTKYTPSTGIPELKRAISEKLNRENNLTYEPSQVVVSCGAKHALYNIFQVLLEKGDEVIIPSPYWVSYPEMVKLAEGSPVLLKTSEDNDFKLKKGELTKALTQKTKALIINSPSNPTGSVYGEEELREIAEVASKSEFYIISDEIYEKLIYDGNTHVSIGTVAKELYERIVIVNGVSKAFSMTGWRLGYLAGPSKIAAAVSRLQDHSTSCPSSISQRAALAAITGGGESTAKMVREFKKRRDYMVQRLNSIKPLSCNSPKGAFYIFCNISKTGMDSVRFSKRLLEEANVALVPGEGFGWGTHVRLSFATSLEEIKKGLDRIEEFVAEL